MCAFSAGRVYFTSKWCTLGDVIKPTKMSDEKTCTTLLDKTPPSVNIDGGNEFLGVDPPDKKVA